MRGPKPPSPPRRLHRRPASTSSVAPLQLARSPPRQANFADQSAIIHRSALNHDHSSRVCGGKGKYLTNNDGWRNSTKPDTPRLTRLTEATLPREWISRDN